VKDAQAVDSTAQAVEEGPADELRPEDVEAYLPESTALVVHDQRDEHEVFRVLDAHDEQMILQEAQRRLLKVSLYDFPQGGERVVDLSYQGVNELVRLMNATGRCKIAVDPSSLTVETIVEDAGNGPEPFFVATVYARDAVTGYGQFGTSMEPQRLRLKKSTADRMRKQGKAVPEDGTVFDVFARAKAVNKAQRNALKVFIPEEIRQTLIAQYSGQAARIERVQTAAEAKVAELPPPLTDEKAKAQVAMAKRLYDEIGELGGGRGKLEFPPGQFFAYLVQSQHDHDTLDRFGEYLEKRKAEIAAKYEEATA
jgi:hypothetical protein